MCAHVRTLCGPQPTAAHGADPAPRGHGLVRRLRSEETAALATMHTNFRSVCSAKGHPRDSPKWAPITTPARCQNLSFRSKKLNFREPDRPFETAAKTTRESTSTKSRRACIPLRVNRLTRLIRHSSHRRLTCFPLKNRYENTVTQFNFKASGAAAARPSCCSVVPRLSNQGARVLPSLRPNRTGRPRPPL